MNMNKYEKNWLRLSHIENVDFSFEFRELDEVKGQLYDKLFKEYGNLRVIKFEFERIEYTQDNSTRTVIGKFTVLRKKYYNKKKRGK